MAVAGSFCRVVHIFTGASYVITVPQSNGMVSRGDSWTFIYHISSYILEEETRSSGGIDILRCTVSHSESQTSELFNIVASCTVTVPEGVAKLIHNQC
jgi:hypothetical protein